MRATIAIRQTQCETRARLMLHGIGPYAYVHHAIRIGNQISKIELFIVYMFEPEPTRLRRPLA